VQLQQTRCSQQWERIRSEINALLNDRYAAICLSRWCQGEELARVLREVRKHLGRELGPRTPLLPGIGVKGLRRQPATAQQAIAQLVAEKTGM